MPSTPRLASLLWAKTDTPHAGPDGFHGGWISLRHHLCDVGLVAARLWDHFLPERAKTSVLDVHGRPIPARLVRQWLIVAGAAHDIGKATPAFQQRVPVLYEKVTAAGLGRAADPEDTGYVHATISAAAVLAWGAEHDVDPDASNALASVVGGHHGSWPSAAELDGDARESVELLLEDTTRPAWGATMLALVDEALDLAHLTRDQLPAPAASWQVALSGLVTLADWAASAYGPYYATARPAPVQDSEARAQTIMAALALTDTWTPPLVDPDQLEVVLREQFGVGADASEHAPATWVQQAVTDEARHGDVAFMMVESRPGSGKTEAAQMGSALVAANGRANGVAFVLPTRATTRQAADRMFRWVRHTSATHASVGAAMTYSRAWLTKTVRDLTPTGPTRWRRGRVPAAGKSPGLVSHQWLSGLSVPFVDIWVATVDHLLALASPRKHADIGHAGIVRRVVVIDEVHSCDPVMYSHLLQVLTWLGRHRVPVIAMSATVSDHLRTELFRAYAGRPDLEVPVQRATARVTTLGLDGALRSRAQERTRSRSIKMQWHEDDNTMLAQTLAAELADGGCALVFRSVVDEARATYDELVRHGGLGEVVLAHSRLTEADRAAADAKLLDMLGNPYREGTVRPERCVIVATQVAEQSLDLDADLLVSDVVPIDSMWQRLGRLHRHQRPGRPKGLRRPRVILLGRGEAGGDKPHPNKGLQAIYGEALLARTYGWLVGRKVLLDPLHIDTSIRAVYGDGKVGPRGWKHFMAYAARAYAAQLTKTVQETTWRTLRAPAASACSMFDTPIAWTRGIDDLETAVRDGQLEHEFAILFRAGDRLYPPTQAVVDHMAGDPDAVLPEPLDRADATLEEVCATLVKVPTQRFGVSAADVAECTARPYWPARGAHLDRIPVMEMKFSRAQQGFVVDLFGRRFRYAPGRGMTWIALRNH
ncbi:CRISPR-associated helicase Cas3' [Pseudactinotalea terrae]|uniref:CRISPR-associated helicase Cas3' n=1 Tax=Pseudactinotalea terrae TaxID=1743262 RepID=UPI0013918EA3|nr:CRISPR-associated helicase Cas3' [Pseudactinotalea terrae]